VAISPNLGQTELAGQHLQVAEEFINRVLAAQPGNRTAMLRSAQIAHDRMIVAGQRRQPDEAFRLGQISGERLQLYLATGQIQAVEAEQVVITYMNVANRYMLVGRYDDAIRMIQRTIEIAKATNQPGQVGAALTIVARAEIARGHLDEAFAAAHDASRRLESASGETVSRKLRYGLALIREATILGDPDGISLGRPADAVPLLEKSFEITEDVASHDTADFDSREQIPLVARLLARLLVDSDPARALAMCDWSLRRTAEVKNNTIARLDDVSVLAASTYPLRALHRTAEARTRLDDAFSRLKQLGRYPADEIKPGSEADDVLSALAEQEAAEGRIARAIEVSRDLLNRVMAAKPEVESKLTEAVEVSRLLASGARLERRAGHAADAAALDSRRLRLWQQWAEKQPGNSFVARQLAAVGSAH